MEWRHGKLPLRMSNGMIEVPALLRGSFGIHDIGSRRSTYAVAEIRTSLRMTPATAGCQMLDVAKRYAEKAEALTEWSTMDLRAGDPQLGKRMVDLWNEMTELDVQRLMFAHYGTIARRDRRRA